MNIYKLRVKRVLDVGGSVLALLVTLPLTVPSAIAIRLSMGSPIFFRQQRPGYQERSFEIVKFRTMRDGSGADAERITKLGKFLRTTSIDELPQLINIVRGEMSFIGPRPLATRYLAYYSENERRRHDVRPGISGLAQIRGRNQLSWEGRFEADLEYVDNVSFSNDFRILVATISKLIKREGISVREFGGLEDFDVYRQAQVAARAISVAEESLAP